MNRYLLFLGLCSRLLDACPTCIGTHVQGSTTPFFSDEQYQHTEPTSDIHTGEHADTAAEKDLA